jgi:hypothetical protein
VAAPLPLPRQQSQQPPRQPHQPPLQKQVGTVFAHWGLAADGTHVAAMARTCGCGHAFAPDTSRPTRYFAARAESATAP